MTQPEKITFTMRLADPKKHSNRFDFAETSSDAPTKTGFRPSFYVPKQHFDGATTIRVTIEEATE